MELSHFIALYALLVLFLEIAHLIISCYTQQSTLKYISKLKNINWFGKSLLIVIYLIVCPISFMIEIIVLLCTLGVDK